MKQSGTRHKARRRAVDLLFEAEAKQVSPAQLVAERRQFVRDDESVGEIHEYTATVIEGLADDQSQIDAVVSSHLRGWTLERLPAVDRAVLRAAAWELLFGSDEFGAPEAPPPGSWAEPWWRPAIVAGSRTGT